MVATRSRGKNKALQVIDEKPHTKPVIPIAFETDDKKTLEVDTLAFEFDNSDCSHFFPDLSGLEDEFRTRVSDVADTDSFALRPPPLKRQRAFVLPPMKTIEKKARRSVMSESIGEDELTAFINNLSTNSFDAAMKLSA